ncbi:HD domain-containing phosphohydrolase [Petroclostridium sp. X23]|uniref:GAF and HD-GYP domain-containing protein n=1 Tax=Petroclostridium sp. X23 TaxID=3045146 RepID=UPI0024AE2DFE|nr:HD domain-containing phosphohydrolase [Petroclostridium sp. X23]WHH61071.1 HD domain-containing protein [Petroclostridium sp. X23]
MIYIVLIAAAVCCTAAAAIITDKNKKIRKMVKQLEIGKKITSNIKFKSLLKEIMETVKAETNAEACSLYLIDEEKQELWFEIALGEKGDKVKEIRLKIGEGIAGWVAKEGVTLNIKDVNEDARFKRDIGKKIDFKQKAMLTMPVKFKDKTIGVLQIINKKGGSIFNHYDEELLEGISSQIAIALENAILYKELHDLLVDAISSLASAIDAKDPYTKGHSQRVTEYSLEIGRELGMSDSELERLEYMGLLHDVGKIGIKDAILNKQAPLDDEEFAMMKTHTLMGEKILGSVKSLKDIIHGAKYHHEKYDGTGYCAGLKGDEIPLEARIIAVADTYDAMTTTRPYRKGLPHEVAVEEINRFAGRQFDPAVVEHFNNAMKKRVEANSGV